MKRDAFADWVRQFLSTCGKDFRFEEIAAEGRRVGALSPDDARALERGAFPRWLVKALGGGEIPRVDLFDALVKRRELCPAARVSVPPARPLAGTFPPVNLKSGAWLAPAVSLIEGEETAFSFAKWAMLATRDGAILSSLSDVETAFVHQHASHEALRTVPGRTLILYVPGAVLFSHWLLDALPRLLMVEEHVPGGLAAFDRVYVNATHQPFHRECLAALGLIGDRVIRRTADGYHLHFEAFAFVTAARQRFVAASAAYPLLRRHFRARAETVAPPAPAGGPRRLLVSRAKTSRRRILNEDELATALGGIGFQRVLLEDLPVAAAAKMFAEAEVIVAPHGAGLANIVFAEPGTKVVEIFSGHLSDEYFTMAGQLELEYYTLQAAHAGGQIFAQREIHSMPITDLNRADILVDPDTILSALAKIGVS